MFTLDNIALSKQIIVLINNPKVDKMQNQNMCVPALSLGKVTTVIRMQDVKEGDTVQLIDTGDVALTVQHIYKSNNPFLTGGGAAFVMDLVHSAVNGGKPFVVVVKADGTSLTRSFALDVIVQHVSVVVN